METKEDYVKPFRPKFWESLKNGERFAFDEFVNRTTSSGRYQFMHLKFLPIELYPYTLVFEVRVKLFEGMNKGTLFIKMPCIDINTK